jgi:hypothetical protein
VSTRVNVYVVCTGERGEGHDPVSAHRHFMGAAHALARLNPGQSYYREADGVWKSVKPNGTDEVWIYRLAVTG